MEIWRITRQQDNKTTVQGHYVTKELALRDLKSLLDLCLPMVNPDKHVYKISETVFTLDRIFVQES